MQLNRIYHEDCLVGLKQITTESIDLVVSDIPYRIVGGGCGTTNKEPSGILDKARGKTKHISVSGVLDDRSDDVRAGLLFTALNGNELFLPITSFCNGKDYTVEYHGLYLSATPCGSNNVYSLHFDQHKASILGGISRNESFYVKLIKRGE